jgi:OOP family OmpA-OmpF porin
MHSRRLLGLLFAAGLVAAAAPAPVPSGAAAAPPPAAGDATSQSGAPAGLSIFFDTGSAAIRPDDEALLDHASRLYNEGRPIVMILTGMADTTGPAEVNLLLSQQRADAVLRGLVARGIPADRFEVLAKGATDPVVRTPPGTAEPRNRQVEITWR